MARCVVHVDADSPLARFLPQALLGQTIEAEADTIDEAIAQLPRELQPMAEEAAREARLSSGHDEGHGLADAPSSGWWASATL